MKNFKDFGIKPAAQSLIGDKIKINKVLNREITVLDYRIENSKYGDNKKCLYIQLELKEEKHVIFTGSGVLMEMIDKVPKNEFPFKTTIIQENERYEFT